MQRLYSMFPKGAPGAALLLMRVSLGSTFVEQHGLFLDGPHASWVLAGAGIVAIALCCGFLTPLACGLCAVAEIVSWSIGPPMPQQMHVCIVLNAVALVLLGPGAYSLDSRAFGRRKVLLPPADPDAP